MFISVPKLAIVLAAVSTPFVEAGLVQERATSLCNKPNYGAQGVPWNSNSVPGSFCGKNKPSNSGQWATIPYWDGGDTVKCSGTSRKSLKVCNGGNPTKPLPSTCNPPHNFPAGWGGISNPSSPKYTIVCKPSPTATCSWSSWWNCFLPAGWKQTCTVVSTSPVTTKPSSSSTKAPVSSAAASSAAASSAAASSVAASSTDAPSSAAASSATDAPSSAAASTDNTPSTTTSAGATQTSTVPNVDPSSYPVCQSTYQVAYQNYTIIAPNGVWQGMTVGAATQDASYMTYTLATSVSDCLAACDQIEGCVFVNTYYDTNETEEDLPKHAPGVLTCSMYSQCVGTDKNDNFGGQDDPNQIYQSNGYCKSGACS